MLDKMLSMFCNIPSWGIYVSLFAVSEPYLLLTKFLRIKKVKLRKLLENVARVSQYP